MFGAVGLNTRNFSKRKKKKEALSSCLGNSPAAATPACCTPTLTLSQQLCSCCSSRGQILTPKALGTVCTLTCGTEAAIPPQQGRSSAHTPRPRNQVHLTLLPRGTSCPNPPPRHSSRGGTHPHPHGQPRQHPHPAGLTSCLRGRWRCPPEESNRVQEVSNPQKDLTQWGS